MEWKSNTLITSEKKIARKYLRKTKLISWQQKLVFVLSKAAKLMYYGMADNIQPCGFFTPLQYFVPEGVGMMFLL